MLSCALGVTLFPNYTGFKYEVWSRLTSQSELSFHSPTQFASLPNMTSIKTPSGHVPNRLKKKNLKQWLCSFGCPNSLYRPGWPWTQCRSSFVSQVLLLMARYHPRSPCLSLHFQCWDFRHVPLCPVCGVLGKEPRALTMSQMRSCAYQSSHIPSPVVCLLVWSFQKL